jgi:hypothetical protein
MEQPLVGSSAASASGLQARDSKLAFLDAKTLSEWIDSVDGLSSISVYLSIAELRADAEQLDAVINAFHDSKKEATSYQSGFTANLMRCTFTLAKNLGSCPGVSSRVLQFWAQELEAYVGHTPPSVMASLYSDMLGLMSEEFQGMSGERWAMNLLAPEMHSDHEALTKEQHQQFLRRLAERLSSLKETYKEHMVPTWLLEGLRKNVNRKKYGFLNFPSFWRVSSTAEGPLSWSSVGWLAVKLGEREGLDIKLFGTGSEEWEFTEVMTVVMPRFTGQLTSLHSVLDKQIKKAQAMESKILALMLSISIGVANAVVRMVILWLAESFDLDMFSA